MKFVSLNIAKRHLYIMEEETHDDVLIDLYIEASSYSIKSYLKEAADSFLDSDSLPLIDSNGDPIVPFEVKIATLLMIGIFYKNRDDNPNGIFEQDSLPAPVKSVLYSLRKPSLA